MEDNITDFKQFKLTKYNKSKLVELGKLTKSLQTCYKLLRPYFKYKPIFYIGKSIVDIRLKLLRDIKEMRKEKENV